MLTPEDLLAGAETTFDVVIPPPLLGGGSFKVEGDRSPIVRIRPLSIGRFQLIMKAAKNDPGLIPLLMVKEALVEPVLTLEQTRQLPLGLVTYLIDQIRQISGLGEKKSPSTS